MQVSAIANCMSSLPLVTTHAPAGLVTLDTWSRRGDPATHIPVNTTD